MGLRLSVLIPSYNAPELLLATLRSVLREGIADMEVIVADDASDVRTEWVVREIADERVRWYGHQTNVGYGPNLNRGLSYCSGELVMLMAQDDILLPGAIRASVAPFDDPSVSVVTRPYYWFYETPRMPARAVYPISWGKNTVVTAQSSQEELSAVFWSVAQLSGLVYRRQSMMVPFNDDIFTAHVWPFVEALKRGSCVALNTFTVAVRTESSMTRHLSVVYAKSPVKAWQDLFDGVFADAEWSRLRMCGHVYLTETGSFLGLIQIRNYSGLADVVRELRNFVKLRRSLVVKWQFVGLGVLALSCPKWLLRLMTDGFKRHVLARRVARRLREGGVDVEFQ